MSASANTLIQLAVPDALRGRVISIYTTVFNGSAPIGGPIVGAIASMWGSAIAFAFSGAISVIAAVAGLAWWRTATPSVARSSAARPSPPPPPQS